MSFEIFRDSIKKVKGPRRHDFTNSLGIKDAYKWIIKNSKDYLEGIDYNTFSNTLKLIGKLQYDLLLNNTDVYFPQGMGKIEVVYKEAVKKFLNGKLVTNMAPDWDATLKLWMEDDDAKQNKLIIRKEMDGYYRKRWKKKGIKVKNLKYLQFKLKRKQHGQ